MLFDTNLGLANPLWSLPHCDAIVGGFGVSMGLSIYPQ